MREGVLFDDRVKSVKNLKVVHGVGIEPWTANPGNGCLGTKDWESKEWFYW
jgi:hypothetical protein